MRWFCCRLLKNYLEGLLAFSPAAAVPSLFAHVEPDGDIAGAEDVADVEHVAEMDHVALHSGPCGSGDQVDGATLRACDIPCANLVVHTDTAVLPLVDEGGNIQRVQQLPMGA